MEKDFQKLTTMRNENKNKEELDREIHMQVAKKMAEMTGIAAQVLTSGMDADLKRFAKDFNIER